MHSTAATCAPCPVCQRQDARRVHWTPWGGLIGPWLVGLVRCQGCGVAYRRKTGEAEFAAVRRYRPIIASVTLAFVLSAVGISYLLW